MIVPYDDADNVDSPGGEACWRADRRSGEKAERELKPNRTLTRQFSPVFARVLFDWMKNPPEALTGSVCITSNSRKANRAGMNKCGPGNTVCQARARVGLFIAAPLPQEKGSEIGISTPFSAQTPRGPDPL